MPAEVYTSLIVAAPAAAAVIVAILLFLQHMKISQKLGHETAADLATKFAGDLDRVLAIHERTSEKMANEMMLTRAETNAHLQRIADAQDTANLTLREISAADAKRGA